MYKEHGSLLLTISKREGYHELVLSYAAEIRGGRQVFRFIDPATGNYSGYGYSSLEAVYSSRHPIVVQKNKRLNI
jgi:hypothetical protein